MTWLAQWFRPKADLPPTAARAVHVWRALPHIPESTPIEQVRFAAVDTETSGLDPRRDRLLSIGAVAVERMRLTPHKAFSAVLRNEAPTTRANVVVHGLTPARQAAGEPPERVLGEFLEFVGKAPCVAFHAPFDRAVLDRALRTELGVRPTNPWIDLAALAPALFPEARLAHGGLDDWLTYFRIRVRKRHDAIHDAQSAAELFLIMLARAGQRDISTLAQLRAAAHVHTIYHRR